MSRTETSRLFSAAGLLTWGMAGVPMLAALVREPAARGAVAALWGLAYVAFAVAFAVNVGLLGAPRPRVRVAALGVETLAALAALAALSLGQGALAPTLLVVIAGQAPFTLGARGAAAWVGAQSVALGAIWLAPPGTPGAAVTLGSYVGFQLFALGAATLVERESTARKELARLHAELVATQALFADSTRGAERLRIARELHDSLGHHLTALSLNLEVAWNAPSAEARVATGRARALTRDLLGEVRGVVGALREDHPVDLARALRMLAAGIPHPRVRLTLPEVAMEDAVLAHAAFRCVQEALTNAVRHAGAENVWIELRNDAGAVAVRARDDGRGVSALRPGHGLTGLRERVEALGGTLDVASAPGRGLTLSALFPARTASGDPS